ncbi:ABC transporter permease [Streptomyces sp. SID4956]|uniref:ABC transporter permease n=1 Tax=Streptomyces sp. SID4956 TaxID=2690290 RepID=UPI0013722AF9|nr:ABC transporter permease subunit [Streptomyces sp. SID4956]
MTAATLPAPDLGTARVTAKGLLRSEWTKLRSVRSLLLTLALSFAFVAGLSAYLLVEGQTLGDSAAAGIPFSFTAVYPLGVLALVVLGVLVVTGEYSSGSIRASVVAAPRRTGLLLAKAAVLTGVTTALGAVMSVLLYLLTRITGAIPSAAGMSLFDPRMFWGVLAGTLLLPFGALFGLVLGSLVRNAAAAITLYFGVFQLGPQIFPAFLPDGVSGFTDWMPFAAMDVVRGAGLADGPYGVGTAVVVLVTWVAALGGVSWWLLKTRDI